MKVNNICPKENFKLLFHEDSIGDIIQWHFNEGDNEDELGQIVIGDNDYTVYNSSDNEPNDCGKDDDDDDNVNNDNGHIDDDKASVLPQSKTFKEKL